MKKIKRALSLVLVFCMLCTMTVTGFAADTTSGGQTDFMKVVHLDAGRKYFSVDSIEKIIDNASADGYNYLELGVGNDGLRFLLDDMSVTVNDKTYTSDEVTKAIQQGNVTYNKTFNTASNGYYYPYTTDTNELTQSEMDGIISYAKDKGISIIPLINSPGHMDAILSAANSLTGTTCSYDGSKRTIDVTNDTAVAFTQALIQKYVNYFAGKGCKYFNMGADEYANDVSNGFAALINSGKYANFGKYVNDVAKIIENANMTPMAFNDGIYYKENTGCGTIDTNILISYWTVGWNQNQENGYSPASASYLAGKGFKILNTNDAWYYVLGRQAGNSSGYTIATAKNGVQNTKYNDVPGENDPTPVGSMICVWCDTPSASYNSTEEANIADLMKTFATNNPEVFAVSNSGTTTPNKAPAANTIKLEYWITNRPVTANNATSQTITTNTAGIATEAGAKLSDIAPSTGTQEGNEMIYWKGTRLSSDKKQTAASDVDRTQSGDDFSYIRNYTGQWQISADGSEWKDVEATDQIVVYYLQKTAVTEEIETQVVDWGVVPHTSYTGGTSYDGQQSFVLVDYAVKYQSGDRSPDSFPTEKTQAFHCDRSSSTVQYDRSAKAYYRHIGMIRAQETSDYEVYMITLTPSSNNAKTAVAQTTTNATRYSYNGTEKVVWVDDEKDLGNFADSSTHHKDYSVGGDPIVKGLDVYNQQGMLVTYYVRAKVTQDSLKVHYIDKATNDEFYNYGIIVNSGTTFDANIALQAGDNWRGNLSNGTVTNSLGKEQTVSADLSTMPEIGAQYRYSNYKCDEVTRSEDGKEVYLYYTFNNAKDFVVDFGSSLTITPEDLGISPGAVNWTASAVTGETYGDVTLDTTNHTLTYTPNQVMKSVDTLQLTLADSMNDKDLSTHIIRIYPASNVMYEENVVKLGDSSDWTTTGKAQSKTQATEELKKEDIHGYDESYETDSEFSNDSAYQAQLTIPSGKDFTETKKATFTFTGTGFDVISECGKNTGMLLAVVKDTDGKTVKSYLVDTYFTGDEKGIISGTDILDYQVPVVRCMGLTQATYTVDVYGYLTNGSGAVKNAAKSAEATTAEGEVSEETVAEVLDDMSVKNVKASEVEATCMDDNSVLLGGTGVEETAAKSRSARAAAATNANVYIDGVRVYNTLNDKNGANKYKESEQNVKYESVYDYVKNSLLDVNEDVAEKPTVYVEYDGDQEIWGIADYKQQGPENEVYLTPGSAIAFALDGYKEGDTVQVSAKAINKNADSNGVVSEAFSGIATASEMYYTVEPRKSDDGSYYVIIDNKKDSDAVLALSNLKISKNIRHAEGANLKETVLEKLNEHAAFTPETFKVSAPENLKYKKVATAVIKTSLDVENVYVSVDNGEETKLDATNKKAVENKKANLYSFSTAIKSKVLGKGPHTYKFYAVNAKRDKSDTVTVTVNITD